MAGEILKKKREELGLEIHEIAESLKIGEEYLIAIENDAFEKLPVPVYTMGYIRCYAAFVGIDADPVIQFYREHLSQPQPSTIIPIAFSQKKGHKIGYIIALAGVVLIAFLLVPRVPKEKRVEFMPKRPPAQEVAGGIPATHAIPEQTAVPGNKDSRGATPTAGEAGMSGSTGQAAQDQHVLSIAADDTTWIAVKFDSGRREEILLRPGQSKNWTFSGKVSLKVGNAGGVRIKLDGADLGKPGGQGEVKNMVLPAAEARK